MNYTDFTPFSYSNIKPRDTMCVLFGDDCVSKIRRKSVSDYTVNTINHLINRGLHFTYATARTINSSSKITSGIKINIPVITRNGTILADHKTKELIEVVKFKRETTDKLRTLLSTDKICGFVTSIRDGQEFKT